MVQSVHLHHIEFVVCKRMSGAVLVGTLRLTGHGLVGCTGYQRRRFWFPEPMERPQSQLQLLAENLPLPSFAT